MWIYLAYLTLGLIAGFASTLLGIGGGVVMVPALLFLGRLFPDLQVTMKVATVTSLAYIVPIALSGAWQGHASGHHIRWYLVALAVPGGLLGTYLGNLTKNYVTATQLKMAFGVLMILVGVRLALAPWTQKKDAAPPEPGRPAVQAPQPPSAP